MVLSKNESYNSRRKGGIDRKLHCVTNKGESGDICSRLFGDENLKIK